jgi:hypothetical protein
MRLPALSAAVILAAAGRLAAQGSAYIPLDDPRLPAFEHLVASGDVRDPSPFVRPFRRADAVAFLDSALAAGTVRDSALVAELKRAWSEDTSQARWEVRARLGAQTFTDANLDPLHPAGPGGTRPYFDLGLTAVFGNFVLQSRPDIETRLIDDPDWPGRKDLRVTGRNVEAYVSAQFRYISLFYGEMDQNWGPAGIPGIGLSNYGYPQPNVGVRIGNGKFSVSALASTLADTTDSLGQVNHRYFFAHRIDAQLSPRFHLGLWETTVMGGPDRNFDARYRNPVTLLLLTNEYGLGDRGNVLAGLDASWRVGARTTLQAQLGLDDLQFQNLSGPTRYPDRYALTLSATGSLLERMSWRAFYTQASSLAFRTTNPIENFTDQGVGLGRNFDDYDQLTFMVSRPVASRWLFTPELTVQRQGQGRINDPVPEPNTLAAGATPTLFIGTVERTFRAALGVSGQEGRLAIQANAGLHYIQNEYNVAGRNRTRFVGRIQATIGIGKRGRF